MPTFSEVLTGLGNLHDCTITSFQWKPTERWIAFEIEDLFFNSEGFPDYQGPLPGRIVLEGVRRAKIEMPSAEEFLRISDFTVFSAGADTSSVLVTLWSGGRIEATYKSAHFPDISPR